MNISQKITLYLKGSLTDREVEELWIHLMMHPEHLDLLEVEWMLSILLGNNPS